MSISYKIEYGDGGVTVDLESYGDQVSSIRWGGAQAGDISNGVGLSVGMKVSGIEPALQAFGFEFSAASPPPPEQPKKKKKFFSKDEEDSSE